MSHPIYNENYFLKYQRYSETPTGEALRKWRVQQVDKLLEEVEGTASLSTAAVADYGCGFGDFLMECAKRRPRKLCGVDINPYCVAHAVKLGYLGFSPEMFEYFYSSNSDYNKVGKGWDVMTFWDSFEHLRDPRQVLETFKPFYVMVSLPNLRAFQKACPASDIQLWKHYRPEEHFWNFTDHDFIKYLHQCGYRVVTSSYGESEFRKDTVLGNENIFTVGAVRDAF